MSRLFYLLSEISVVIESKFSIHTQNITTFDFCERVDLDLCRILLLEEFVQFDEDVGSLFLTFRLEFELLGDFECLLL